MTEYSSIINKTVEDAMSDGGFDASLYAPKVYDKITEAERKRTSLARIRMDLATAANNMAKRAMKAQAERQQMFGFMDLPGAVAVDDEGKKIKFTFSLKRLEFVAAKKRRETDRSSLDTSIGAMTIAEAVAAPYWDANPDWTLGQCLEQAEKDRPEGDAA